MSFLFENKIQTLRYLLIWLLYMFIQAVCLQWIVDVPFGVLLIDAFTHALMFAFFGMVLRTIMSFGNYEAMPVFQRIINYTAFGFFILLVWVGVGYGLNYLFFEADIVRAFLPLLPLYTFIGGLLYLILILYFRGKITLIKTVEERVAEVEPIVVAEEKINVDARGEEENLRHIAVKSGSKIHVIPIPDILYLQADGDYVQIYTKDGRYMKEQTMKYYDENLPTAQFVRVHRSFIVNIESISRIEQYEKQNQLLALKNGDHIKASMTGYKLLKNKLGL